jgi:peptidoglycan L-alanyl-D-glutamate endopeptidase CwlK
MTAMLNSRDINLLRPDVAANCKTLITLAKAAGYDVLVTGTVRDDAYQMDVYNKGYSKAKVPTFHSQKAGLAFDICQNIKGKEYTDAAFWKTASVIGKQLGFTWGGDWKSIIDKPHFQWDNHGKYTGTMVRNGQLPPQMPIVKDEANDKEVLEAVCTEFGLDRVFWEKAFNGTVTVSKDIVKALFRKIKKAL